MRNEAAQEPDTDVEIIEADPAQIMESLPVRQQAYALLRDQGFSNTEATKALDMTRQNGNLINKRLAKYMITGNAKLLKDANRAVKNLVAGKPIGCVEKVKDSTVLAAAQMVYDRVDPIKRTDSGGPQTVSFTQINLNISNSAPSTVYNDDQPACEVNDNRDLHE